MTMTNTQLMNNTPMTNQKKSIQYHLVELRKRLLISVSSVIIGTFIAFAFHRYILEFLSRPLAGTQSNNSSLVFTEVTELFSITMKISILGGIIISLPILFYQVVLFIAPGMTSKEKKYLLVFLPGTMIAFIIGIFFGYFVLLPPALHFLITFGEGIAEPMIRIGNYISLLVNLLFWMGLAFETPFIMLMIAKLGIVHPRKMASFRKYSLVLAFILAAFITPTFDPVNQTIVALPLVVLYEIGILMARVGTRGKGNQE